MTTGFQQSIGSLTSPLTTQGRVAVNAVRDHQDTRIRQRDRRIDPTGTVFGERFADEDQSIEPHELCLMFTAAKGRNAVPSDTDFNVFSNANGLRPRKRSRGSTNETPEKRRKRQRAALYEELQTAGIASNRARYDPTNTANEEMLAIQIGGLQTIYNTGNLPINAGHVIVWELPENANSRDRPRIQGVEKSKLLFQTVPYEAAAKKVSDEQRAAVAAFKRDDDADKLITALITLDLQLRKRVLGKALSCAKPGKPFDLMLGHYCA